MFVGNDELPVISRAAHREAQRRLYLEEKNLGHLQSSGDNPGSSPTEFLRNVGIRLSIPRRTPIGKTGFGRGWNHGSKFFD
jgi:hypothetical protein